MISVFAPASIRRRSFLCFATVITMMSLLLSSCVAQTSDTSRSPTHSVSPLDAPPRLTITEESPLPRIHGASVVGTTPGRPFLYRIAATGMAPLTFAARSLPAGLSLNPVTGIIAGTLKRAGVTRVTVSAHNHVGQETHTLTIIGGHDKLAQAPPMGWNSWNVWGTHVDEAEIKAAADALITFGLAAHGYEYINIDDSWEAEQRDSTGHIQANDKFPNMRGLTDYLHGKGLLAGIYSSPGPTTCGGYTASYGHELQDAQTYADWGFDYLKYDWCSYGDIVQGDRSLPTLQKPYVVMRDALATAPRDIVYSLCQYGMGDVWKWGEQVHGNSWRTTGDLHDNWQELHQIYEAQDGLAEYAGPGHWNDPDMLQVGVVGIGDVRPTHLTPNEQILHISLWAMFAAPLLIGCDMTRLDPFTRAILTNDEIIDVDQDPLGHAASKAETLLNGCEVWMRPLADGATAIALVNPNEEASTAAVSWQQLRLNGQQNLRDLWLHRDLGSYADGYSVEVPAHGVVVLKASKDSK